MMPAMTTNKEDPAGSFNPVVCGFIIKPCPFCGADGEAQEYHVGQGVYQKLICCTNSGDEDGLDECPMYIPNQGFYKSTLREAANAWNARAV